MEDYTIITVKNREFAVLGKNKKIIPFKNSFTKKINSETNSDNNIQLENSSFYMLDENNNNIILE